MIQERHAAKVVSTDDPEKRGRVRVACSGVLGDEESDLPMWVEPLLPWGFFLVPDVGETVEIVIDTCGEQDEVFGQTSMENPDPKWLAARYYQKDENEEGDRKVPADFTSKNYGKRRGFKTPAGHVLIFDDTSGDELVSLTCAYGPKASRKTTVLSMDKAGTVTISTEGTVSVQANHAELKAQTVDIVDGADDYLVRGNALKTWLDGHTHPDGMGGTGPPVVPLPASAISTQAKVK